MLWNTFRAAFKADEMQEAFDELYDIWPTKMKAMVNARLKSEPDLLALTAASRVMPENVLSIMRILSNFQNLKNTSVIPTRARFCLVR